MTASTIQTERPSSHSAYSKTKNQICMNDGEIDDFGKQQIANFGKIAINKDELKVILREMKKLEVEN